MHMFLILSQVVPCQKFLCGKVVCMFIGGAYGVWGVLEPIVSYSFKSICMYIRIVRILRVKFSTWCFNWNYKQPPRVTLVRRLEYLLTIVNARFWNQRSSLVLWMVSCKPRGAKMLLKLRCIYNFFFWQVHSSHFCYMCNTIQIFMLCMRIV